MLLRIISFITFSLAILPAVAAENASLPPAGLSAEEAMRLGEAMYQQGTLPSGKPMEATVQGDLKVSAGSDAVVTCSNCHMRSGLGSYEGLVLTPPTNGANLYAPLLYARDFPGIVGVGEMAFENERPAYTDETLARVIREGLDPTGRVLNDVMPRYLLDDGDMARLVSYLKSLSTEFSPGVTENNIHFATVISEDVSLADREAMLAPLQKYIAIKNNKIAFRYSGLKRRLCE